MKATEIHKKFMKRAIDLALRNIEQGGGPFGAIVVKDGEIIAEGWNEVTPNNDPTAHAEVQAIRKACKKLSSFELTGCEVYTSCEPCPMCLGAIYWSRPAKVYYALSREDAAGVGFDDEFIYQEIQIPHEKRKIPMHFLNHEDASAVFSTWKLKEDKTHY